MHNAATISHFSNNGIKSGRLEFNTPDGMFRAEKNAGGHSIYKEEGNAFVHYMTVRCKFSAKSIYDAIVDCELREMDNVETEE